MGNSKQLAEAAVSGSAADIRRLAKSDPEAARHWKPIMDAAYHGRAKNVAALLRAGADPNVLQGTGDRHRPLTRCLEPKKTFPRGPDHQATARTLIEAGADLEAVGVQLFLPTSYMTYCKPYPIRAFHIKPCGEPVSTHPLRREVRVIQ